MKYYVGDTGMNNELYHHGILGMKWGVRRYQNPDGSLTDAGRRRYGSMSSKKIRNELKKSIRNARAKKLGGSNRWMVNSPIGPNSEKVISEHKNNYSRWKQSEAYKKWEKKYNDFEREWAKKNYVEDYEGQYDELYKQLIKQKPRQNWNSLDFAVTYTSTGKKYAGNYLKKGGRDLSIAYLKDLGYNQKAAEWLADRMLLKNETLGDI